MRDFSEDLSGLSKRVADSAAVLDRDAKAARYAELEHKAADPGLWDDPDAARLVTTEMSRLKSDLDVLSGLESRLGDAQVMYQLGTEEHDDSLEPELAALVATLDQDLTALELRSLFTGEHDDRDAVCEVHAGAGGTDAQDWAEMLMRMYLRWAERRGFEAEVEEVSAGQEAGILSATFIIRGPYAYGLLTGEKGVHRLVRISPFDSQKRRQTSFASFDVVPFLEEAAAEVGIDEKDLRIDTYRSSGAGGQHVNVTDSAVRITHLPTGIVVSCQNQRSQHQNKAVAMQILAAKLAERAREERRAELDALSGPKSEVGWGQGFRNYVLAPYQQAKDDRTKHETGNVMAVLDGDLDAFMESYLRWRQRSDR